MEPNSTAWVDRNITRFWDSMHRVVPDESWLPKAEVNIGRTGKRKVVVEEFGCGHYGCVMPTSAPDTVLKLTSDAAEAAFVRAAIEISDRQKGSADKWARGEWPDGIVRYKAIYQLADASHRKRPVFLLWRQEAYETGFMIGPGGYMVAKDEDPWKRRETQQASMYLGNAQSSAAFVREWVKKKGAAAYADLKADSGTMRWAFNYARENWDVLDRNVGDWHRLGRQDVDNVIRRHRGKDRAAVALSFYAMTVELMRHNNAVVSTVGTAMDYYLDEGIVLADVHLNNIGKIQEEDYDGLVTAITDPGHAVFLNDNYDGLTIEVMDP